MIGLIDAIITVFPALLVISIVLSVPIAFASLWALKMTHKADIFGDKHVFEKTYC